MRGAWSGGGGAVLEASVNVSPSTTDSAAEGSSGGLEPR